MKNLILAASASVALAACATSMDSDYYVDATGEAVPPSAIEPYSDWPKDYSGRTVRIETQSGLKNNVNFAPDGTMTIEVVGSGLPVVEGFYGMQGNNVCINFSPRGQECWPYVQMAVGETRTVTSDRGQTLKVTMYDNQGALKQ